MNLVFTEKPVASRQTSRGEAKERLAAKTYQDAEMEAEPRWELVEKYLPLVKSIVARMRIYFPPEVDIEDIYSVGISGLITATCRCDPKKIKSFGSYATLRVRGAILDELRRLDWMPRANRVMAKKYRRVIEELEQKLGRAAAEEEICEAMELTTEEYRKLMDRLRPISFVSLDKPLNADDSENATVHEVIPDDTLMNARESCEHQEVLELLRKRIHELPEMPQKVLIMYYFEGMRLAEIAAVFGLTESRICQIHAQAVIGLRAYLRRVITR